MIKLSLNNEYFDFQIKNEYLVYLIPFLMLTDKWLATFVYSVAIMCIFLLNKYKEDKMSLTIPNFLIWLLLLIWGSYIAYKSPFFGTGVSYYIGTIVVPFLIFVIICNIKITQTFLKNFFNLLILSGVIISLVSLYIFISVGLSDKGRIGGLWTSYNILSAYLMILFMFNLSFIINKKKNDKLYLYLVSIILILLGIFLTLTRGVWLAMVITIIIFVIRKPKIIIPSLFFIGIIVFLFYDTIYSRFLTVKYFGSDVSSLGRMQAWISSLILIKNNMFLGYGFDSYVHLRDSVFPIYFIDVVHSHNTYLRTILEMGLIGFLLYFSFIFKAYIYTIRLNKNIFYKDYKRYIDGFLMSFPALFIVFMFEPYFSLYGLSTFIIWVLISIIFNLYQALIRNS